MTVSKLRQDYLNSTTFGCFRYFYSGDDGELMPSSFEFVTEEVNEMEYTWKVDYKLDSNGNFSNLKSVVVESGIRKVEDKHLFISQITISVGKKLLPTDFAEVTIFINGDPVTEPLQFDSLTPLSMASKPKSKFMIKGPSIIRLIDVGFGISVMDVFIKIERKCEKNTFSNQIVKDYAILLKNKTLSDVTFIFGNNKELPAHSQILAARNPVFASMFESDMLEKKNGRVEITDIESNIFQHLLQFLYTEELAICEMSDWLELIVAADKYSITTLVKLCENRILHNLKTHNAIDVFVTATLVNSEVMKEKCVQFIINNKSEVVKTTGYTNLVESRKDLATELLRYLLER